MADRAPGAVARGGIFYSGDFALPLPAGHRFPMEKYPLLRARVLADGLAGDADIHVPRAATDEELLRVHHARYVERVVSGVLTGPEQRRIGFPWSPAMVERSRRSVGATIEACGAALECGTGVNLAGGTHHAASDHGEGYCVFNDVAVAIRTLQAGGRIATALVVDCDVHQGNGTSRIFAGDASVFTLDLFGANNFPFDKATGDLDVPLVDSTGDAAYLVALTRALDVALASRSADLAVYVSGADPFEEDRLGRLALSKPGLAARDRLVLGTLRQAGIPVAVVMAGGYGRDVRDTVEIHAATVRETLAWRVAADALPPEAGLGA